MPITISCTCGNTLEVQDMLAGQRLNCPVCGGAVTASAAEEADADMPIIEEPEANQAGSAPAAPKKKKKSKKNDITPLTKVEKREQKFEREEARKALASRVARGFAYLIMGIIITACAAYGLLFYNQALLERLDYGAVVVGILVIGLAATSKGLWGLVFGQFVGD
jgi:hypothetical protein